MNSLEKIQSCGFLDNIPLEHKYVLAFCMDRLIEVDNKRPDGVFNSYLYKFTSGINENGIDWYALSQFISKENVDKQTIRDYKTRIITGEVNEHFN